MKNIFLIITLLLSTGIIYAQTDSTRFKLNIRAGINNSFFKIEKEDPEINTQIQNDFSPKLGLEAEYVFPFDKFRWSTIAELYYQSYNYNNAVQYQRTETRSNFDNIDISYYSLNFLLGLKYTYAELGRFRSYMAVKTNYAHPLNDAMIDYETLEDFEIINGLGFLASLGFVYNRKISFEFEYATRTLVDKNIAKTRLNTFTFLMAYRLM